MPSTTTTSITLQRSATYFSHKQIAVLYALPLTGQPKFQMVVSLLPSILHTIKQKLFYASGLLPSWGVGTDDLSLMRVQIRKLWDIFQKVFATWLDSQPTYFSNCVELCS